MDVGGQARFDSAYVSTQINADVTLTPDDLDKVLLYQIPGGSTYNIYLPSYPTTNLRLGMTTTIRWVGNGYYSSGSSFVINGVFNDSYGSGTTTVTINNSSKIFRGILTTLPVGSGYGWFNIT